jgi:alkylation response protein AidB-like acyl-CoA dehydrogenase
MRFELSETQKQIEKTARQFLSNECPIGEVRRLMETSTAHDAALWKKMADQGWTGMIFPEEFGGMGLGMIEMAATFEQMGRALLPGPFYSTVALAGPLIQAAASVDQKRMYLTPLCEGTLIATAALIEGEADWDTAAWHTTCSNGKLSGRKMFVTDAAAADLIVVAAQNGLFIVPKGAPGMRIVPLKAIDVTRKMYEVSFENTPAEKIAEGAAAERAIAYALKVATVALTAEMAGGMQKLIEITVAYAKARKQFDQPIGKFQAVQHMCADMFLWSESTKSAVYYAAYALEKDLPEADSAVAVAKVYAGDAYRETGNRAIQVHGGMGFTWENDVHLYYRRAKACETALGDAAYHRERIARTLVEGDANSAAVAG